MKPHILYRGIVISDDQIKTAPYFNTTLTPFHPAKINDNGKKIISDGNEYGVYMSDNQTMIECAYSKGYKYHGRPLSQMRIFINGAPTPITYPSIGVVYTITTDGLNIREPWICKSMSGHYNNGFAGKEWLADAIPVSNYRITKFIISADWLHPEQIIHVTDLNEAHTTIENILRQRRIRLQRLHAVIEQLPERRRMQLTSDDAQTLVNLFGEGGAGYTLPACLHPTNANEYAKYLLTYFYRRNKEMDWTNLNYVTNLLRHLPASAPLTTLVTLVQKDLAQAKTRRDEFILRKIMAGENIKTAGFDANIARYENVLQLILQQHNEML